MSVARLKVYKVGQNDIGWLLTMFFWERGWAGVKMFIAVVICLNEGVGNVLHLLAKGTSEPLVGPGGTVL